MKTIKIDKKDLKIEYIRYCDDMLLNNKNNTVKEDFAEAYIEHQIGCFGFFNNDFFISKNLDEAKKEIIKTLKEG